jgi:hypothetical protein
LAVPHTWLVHVSITHAVFEDGQSVAALQATQLPWPSHTPAPASAPQVVPAAAFEVPQHPAMHVARTHADGPAGQDALLAHEAASAQATPPSAASTMPASPASLVSPASTVVASPASSTTPELLPLPPLEPPLDDDVPSIAPESVPGPLDPPEPPQPPCRASMATTAPKDGARPAIRIEERLPACDVPFGRCSERNRSLAGLEWRSRPGQLRPPGRHPGTSSRAAHA